MEYMTLDIILAVILVIMVIYCIIMIGVSSKQGADVEYAGKEITVARNSVKAKYNVA